MEKKERGERGEQRKRGQREVRAASRTICPGWPRNGGKEESGVKREHREQKRMKRGKQ